MHHKFKNIHMNKYLLLSLLYLISVQNMQAQVEQANLPLPTPSQLAWQQAELGVLISYDLPVFQGKPYNQTENRIVPIPNMNIFNPQELNTDQWIKATKSAGAKFAVLTVTHETGFALYQSEVNPYCMKALKFQNGKGDIVNDFVKSCRKYGIMPGLYIGIRWNAFFGVHDFKIEGESQFVKNRQTFYKKMCEGMVKELCTRYGDLFMIWFDGGADDPTKYGADVLPIVQKYQPKCLFYHNTQLADFRWGGSESGTVPYPCWSTFAFPFSHADKKEIVFANNFELLKHGDKEGKYWMPAMSDAPLRGYNGGHDWFWNPNEDNHVYPLNQLMKMYNNSVGHNSTLILGITPDNSGLLPDADVKRLQEFGKEISKTYSNPLATANGAGNSIEIKIPQGKTIHQLVLQEDIIKGERVRAFTVEAEYKGQWQKVVDGSCIGNKFIHQFTAIPADKIRLNITASIATPIIKQFAVY
jgi:alpha-L-fucosidase